MKVAPGSVGWFYDPQFGIGYIFLANLISSAALPLLLLPELTGECPWRFNGRLLREMLSYSFPLLILGIAGILNQTIDKILYPYLVSDPAEAMTGLGIYGAQLQDSHRDGHVHPGVPVCLRAVHIRPQQRERPGEIPGLQRRHEVLHDIRAAHIPRGHVLPRPAPLLHIATLLLGAEGRAGHHARRAFLRHILQPVALVQAHRPHDMGRVVLTARLSGDRGAQRRTGAAHGLHGLRMGPPLHATSP